MIRNAVLAVALGLGISGCNREEPKEETKEEMVSVSAIFEASDPAIAKDHLRGLQEHSDWYLTGMLGPNAGERESRWIALWQRSAVPGSKLKMLSSSVITITKIGDKNPSEIIDVITDGVRDANLVSNFKRPWRLVDIAINLYDETQAILTLYRSE